MDAEERVDGALFVIGNENFRPELVDVYEIGYRSRPNASVSWSLTTFYNDYAIYEASS